MITEQNRWVVIEAYLAGHLDESGRQEVVQKMIDDAEFKADVLMQYALNEQLDRDQTTQDYALVDRLLGENLIHTPVAKPMIRRQLWWQQSGVWGAAVLVLLLGIGYLYWPAPATLSVRIGYEQRGFGMSGTPNKTHRTTFPVEFSADGPAKGEYSSAAGKLQIYLSDLPADAKKWHLRDDPATGNFLLITPQGQTYRLDRDTYGKRKSLVE